MNKREQATKRHNNAIIILYLIVSAILLIMLNISVSAEELQMMQTNVSAGDASVYKQQTDTGSIVEKESYIQNLEQSDQALEQSNQAPEVLKGWDYDFLYIPYESATYFLQCKEYSDGITIVGYEGRADGALIIPDYIEGFPVIGIETFAFHNCSGFRGDLELPSNLAAIESYAFADCTGLTGDLIIPESCFFIDKSAFNGCSGFNGRLVLPSNIQTISDRVFYNCSGFTGNLLIPEGTVSIGAYAFYNCYGFTGDLIFPDSVTYIGNNAFANCYGFSGILKLSEGLDAIKESAFYYCSGLTGNLTIPSQITNIGQSAFYNCSGFTGDLIIPNTLKTIGQHAFYGCTGFNSNVFVTEGTQSIGAYAFMTRNFSGNTTIWAPANSAAHIYATKNNSNFHEWIFTDVFPSSWQYAGIDYANKLGIMNGVGNNLFSPETNITREQFAVVLYSYESKPQVDFSNKFNDVQGGNWYSDAIIWASENNVTSGYPDGRFGVGDNITREQFVTMLYGYAKSKGYIDTVPGGNLDNFSDAYTVSHWAYDALLWATQNGIMSGKISASGEGILDSQGNATRAECATMMMQFNKKY